MLSNLWFYASILAIVIIVALAFYAYKLLMKLKQQTEASQQAKLEQQLALAKHDSKVLNSVIIIVRAMKEHQCDMSEGCWRLCVLLDSLKLSDNLSTKFPAIFELYDAIKHMSILDERKQLAKQQRMKQDVDRMTIEAKLAEPIQQDIASLHQFAQQQLAAFN